MATDEAERQQVLADLEVLGSARVWSLFLATIPDAAERLLATDRTTRATRTRLSRAQAIRRIRHMANEERRLRARREAERLALAREGDRAECLAEAGAPSIEDLILEDKARHHKRDQAAALAQEAKNVYEEGDYGRVFELLDEAAQLDPDRNEQWSLLRDAYRDRIGGL